LVCGIHFFHSEVDFLNRGVDFLIWRSRSRISDLQRGRRKTKSELEFGSAALINGFINGRWHQCLTTVRQCFEIYQNYLLMQKLNSDRSITVVQAAIRLKEARELKQPSKSKAVKAFPLFNDAPIHWILSSAVRSLIEYLADEIN
jgi:hypothetical protein